MGKTYIKGISGFDFTADTGKVLDWQMGFKDPAGAIVFMDFLGINKKKRERQARDEFPTVTTCDAAVNGMRAIQDILANKSKQKYKIAAYEEILKEYTAFYNNNCIKPVLAVTPVVPIKQAPELTPDPVLQSAATLPAATTEKKELIKGVPNWALIAGAAVLLIGGVILVVKK